MIRGNPHDCTIHFGLPVRVAAAIMVAIATLLGAAVAAEAQSPEFAKLQNDRLVVVRKLMEQMVIQRFTRLPDGSQCQVMVGPRFHTLSFADKEKWMSVPWTYCRAADERAAEMPIVDPAQGNSQIGIFTSEGLALAN